MRSFCQEIEEAVHQVTNGHQIGTSIYIRIMRYRQDIKKMKLSSVLLVALAFTLHCAIALQQPPLKAMLYCYLPAVNTTDPIPEYQNLAAIINQKLEAAQINVRVQVCDPNGNGSSLYDETAINTLFESYDILEVDVSYLWAITTELLSFGKDQISYYSEVHEFEWEPTTREIDGEERLVGSPGLLCSTFVEKRKGGYQDRLYAKFVSSSAFGLVDLYLNTFVNQNSQNSLDNVDYSSVNDETIRQVANFLKRCQDDSSQFNYDSNWCLKKLKKPFFQTNYSTTVGYSENLFNFLNAGIDKQHIEIDHISGGAQKKIFYIDSFVAKKATAQNQTDTVLKFYEFMISDEILDLYVKGQYTNAPQLTYLIPPTIDYLQRLVSQQPLYESIYQSAFLNKTQLPLYNPDFAQNVYGLAGLIDSALQAYSTRHHKQHHHKPHHLTMRQFDHQ